MNSEQAKEIKQAFFAMRNGVVAQQLRNALPGYTTVLGLMVPQIAEISRRFTPSMEFASELWGEKGYRECRLAACYLFPEDEVTLQKACELVEDLATTEEADMLAFRLLKRLPFAAEIAERYAGSDDAMLAYASRTLRNHLS